MARSAEGRRSSAGVSRRRVIAGCASAPFLTLPAVALAAPPRRRLRRRAPGAAVQPEHSLFAGGVPSLTQMQHFIDGLWATLQAHVARGGAPALRQGDLLAGLALRYGRPEVLAQLLAVTAAQPGWEARRAKWETPDSPWRRRWLRAGRVTWAWHDAGVLTRSTLPLKLPS